MRFCILLDFDRNSIFMRLKVMKLKLHLDLCSEPRDCEQTACVNEMA